MQGADPKLIDALGRASSLELFHLSTIIERMLADPRRIIAVRATGCGRDIISELESTMRFGCVGHSAKRWPCTVSFEQTCR